METEEFRPFGAFIPLTPRRGNHCLSFGYGCLLKEK